MIASNNENIDVDDLMRRVREEVAAMRAVAASPAEAANMLAVNGRLPEIVVDLSRHAVITELIEDAARMSRPRTALPARLERPPFGAFRPLVRFGLRVLAYALKDQRHVNAATQQSMRELLRLSSAIGNHVAKLSSVVRDQKNASRDIASIEARLSAAEERTAALFERFGSPYELIVRIDERITAVENAMTANAGRIDALETTPLDARVTAIEHAMTTNAGRIDQLETKPVDARLLALETAHTIATQRVERLEAFREVSNMVASRVDENHRDLSAERERALRSEASLRSELTAQLNAVNALMRGVGIDDAGAQAASVEVEDRYGDVHLAIADRFRGDNDTIRTELGRYLDVVVEGGFIDSDHPLVDVGSGRGEWLGVLRSADVPAFGIDSNPVLAARASAEGFDIVEGDALSVLRSRPPESLGGVTAFHLIEHLRFEDMIALFDESLRVLVPGGVLICETPNPSNVTIGACNFYLDPTHQHPLPAPLISYLFELRGFTGVTVIELAPNDAMRLDEDTESARRINGFFYGSQNYAVIGRKPGAPR